MFSFSLNDGLFASSCYYMYFSFHSFFATMVHCSLKMFCASPGIDLHVIRYVPFNFPVVTSELHIKTFKRTISLRSIKEIIFTKFLRSLMCTECLLIIT